MPTLPRGPPVPGGSGAEETVFAEEPRQSDKGGESIAHGVERNVGNDQVSGILVISIRVPPAPASLSPTPRLSWFMPTRKKGRREGGQ